MGLFSSVTSALGAINPVAAAGTFLAGGGLDFISQRQQNIAAAQQAAQQENFQEMMSNTSHQREVADLKAAGLNPILSANAGASTPSGAMAPVVPELSKLASSPVDVLRMTNDFLNSSASRDALRQQALTGAASAKQSDVQAELLKKQLNEGQLSSKVFAFLNDLVDRFTASSAARSGADQAWQSRPDGPPNSSDFDSNGYKY